MPRVRRVDRSSYDVGVIVSSASGITPPNTLLCDGSEVSRSTYARLFEKISTTFGAGNGTSTFNLPDFRSRMPLGAGVGAGTSVRVVGQSLGSDTVGLTSNEIPSHGHAGTTTNDPSNPANQNAHTHNYSSVSTYYSTNLGTAENHPSTTVTDNFGAAGSHSHTITISNPAGSSSTVQHENMSPFVALNFYIAFR